MLSLVLGGIALFFSLVSGQNCYYGPGAKYQASGVDLVPCQNSGNSACCIAGDTCLAGNACFNYDSGVTYQYGCTDITYKDESCPFKCGWSPDHSPWTALEYCSDLDGAEDTWVCHSPESCGCDWRSTYDLLVLPPRGCKEMGSLARVAVYGPETLQPYAKLPTSSGGSTAYFKPGTTTAVDGYTPDSIGPTTYATPPPEQIVKINPGANPSPSEGTARLLDGSLPPIPSTGVLAESSSIPPQVLRGSTSGLPAGTGGGSGGGNNGAKPTSSGAASGSNSGGSSSSSGDSSSGGLSTGAKVGIGFGIAGVACLVAAIILVIFVLRKRKQPPKQVAGVGHYSDNVPTYNDKTHDSYLSGTTAGNFDGHRSVTPVGGYYHEAPGTPQDEEIIKKRLSPQGPQELDSGFVHEMESATNTPAQTPIAGGHSRNASSQLRNEV